MLKVAGVVTDTMSYLLLDLIYGLLRRAWRWITAAGNPRDRSLRAATLAVVVIAITAVVVLVPVLMVFLVVGAVDALVLTALAMVMLTVVGFAPVIWLRSRQASSIELARRGADDGSDRCCVCEQPRQRRYRLAFLRDWRYCPECNAAYCEDCRGLLWTSAERGWTAECLECGHEWSVPVD